MNSWRSDPPIIMTTEELTKAIPEWFENAHAGLDLTDHSHLEQVTQLAETILELESDEKQLAKIERDLCDKKNECPLLVHLAIKVARSRVIVSEISGPLRVSVVFAVYKEHERILSAAENPVGEDFLRRKVEQLSWLLGTDEQFTWKMIVVDDGCSEGSGHIAEKIASDMGEDRISVLYLEDAIDEGLPVTEPMRNTSESQKGGAIALGLDHAAQEQGTDHIVVFTDADLSTHLGQVGLLLDGIVNRGQDVSIGSRREETSIAVKQGSRNTRGKLFIYLWKRLFPALGDIIDTQCGFKAFNASCLPGLVSNLIEKKFAFDIELLLRAQLARAESIEKVPIAWIDSEEASTTTSLQPYLPMLKKMATMYHTYLPSSAEGDEFSGFIDQLNEDDWARLCEEVPEGIATREPYEFEKWNEIRACDLKAIFNQE